MAVCKHCNQDIFQWIYILNCGTTLHTRQCYTVWLQLVRFYNVCFVLALQADTNDFFAGMQNAV